jgi:hypothetical protein
MTTAGTWYPPSCGTGGFLIELTNPPFTMTDPIEPTQTPELPPGVFAELLADALRATRNRTDSAATTIELARLAYAAGAKVGAKDEYQRGADAELEACCEWLERDPYGLLTRGQVAGALRSARRPKPTNLKAQALDAMGAPTQIGEARVIEHREHELIRRALESLPDPQ